MLWANAALLRETGKTCDTFTAVDMGHIIGLGDKTANHASLRSSAPSVFEIADQVR